MKHINEAGEWHKVNGPAMEWRDKDYTWWYNGQRHRYYGPARLLFGYHTFWIFGELIE